MTNVNPNACIKGLAELGGQSLSSDVLKLISESDFGCSDFDLRSLNYWDNVDEDKCFVVGKSRCMRVGKTSRRRFYHRTTPSLLAVHSENKLRKAASCGMLEDVKRIVECNPALNLDAPDEKKRTALHFSSAKGVDDIVHILLKNGADPNVRDLNGNTPLHLAACTSHIRVVTLLLHFGGDATALDRTGKTPLHLALSHLDLFQKHGESSQSSTEKRRREVCEIAALLREFLQQKGTNDERNCVTSVLQRLENSKTDSEIDEVGELLADFTRMALSSHYGNSSSV